MNWFSKKITEKQRLSLRNIIWRDPPPTFRFVSRLKEQINLWFQFLERLALTGLLVYLSEKSHNIVLRILVLITLFIWFTYIMTFFSYIEIITLDSIAKKSKLWWHFIVLSIIALGILLYVVFQFIDLFYVLH
jgi:hypothetical protein